MPREDAGAGHVVIDWNRGGDRVRPPDIRGLGVTELADQVVDLDRGAIRSPTAQQ